MSRMKKVVSSCLAVVLLAGFMVSANIFNAFADDSSYTADISAEIQNEEGSTESISGTNFISTKLNITSDSLTVTMVYSGRSLKIYDAETEEYTDTSVENEDGNKVYTFSITDINEKIAVTVVAGGATGGILERYLVFSADDATLAKISEIYGQSGDSSDDGISDGKYTVETIATDTDGITAYGNAKHVSTATLEVSGGAIAAYITSTEVPSAIYGGELTFNVEYTLYSSETGYNQYKLTINDINSAVSISYGPSDRYTYLITFDLSTLKADDAGTGSGGSDDGTDDGGSDDFVINATHTIQVQAQNEDGSENARGADLVSTAQLVITDSTIVAYVSASGRELQFEDENGNFTNDVVSYADDVRIYRIVLSDLTDLSKRIYTQFPAGGSATGVAYYYLAFLTDTLTAAGTSGGDDTGTGDGTDDEVVYDGVATFAINVEAQNEDGSINEQRNQYLTSTAKLEVSYHSLVVYVSASERELFFENEDGEFVNEIVSTDDGVRTYKIALANLTDRIRVTFNVSGDNPYYDSSMPIFYLAFSTDAETLALIQGVYDGTIDPNDIVYTDTDDGSSSDGSDTTASGTAAKTGDASLVPFALFAILSVGIIACALYLRKRRA